jgi:hypothetical protein
MACQSVLLSRRGNLLESNVDGQLWRNSGLSLLLYQAKIILFEQANQSLNFIARDDIRMGKTAARW